MLAELLQGMGIAACSFDQLIRPAPEGDLLILAVAVAAVDAFHDTAQIIADD